MADTKITALAAIGANPINVATFPIPMVDLVDTSMAASGTTKKVTVNQILGAGGTATFASVTVTGAVVCNGAVTLGDAVGDAITATGSFTSYTGQAPSSIRAAASDYAAVNFDGATANTRIASTITTNPITTGDYTVWSRFRVPTTSRTDQDPLWTLGSDAFGTGAYGIIARYFTSSNLLNILVRSSAGGASGGDSATADVTIPFATYAGQVVDLVVVRVGSVLTVYLNGTSLTVTYAGTQATFALAPGNFPTNPAQLFSVGGSTTTPFRGRIYRSVVFNRALSASDVTELITLGVNPADQWGTQTAAYTSDFSVNTDSWSATNGTAAGNIDGIGGQDNNLRYTIGSGANTADGLSRNSTVIPSKRYRLNFAYYIPSGQTQITTLRAFVGLAQVIGGLNVTNAWTDVLAEGIASGDAFLRVNQNFVGTGNGTDVFYIRAVTATRIGAIVDLDFTVGAGYQATDRSSNNLHGTLFNGVEFTQPKRVAVLYATTTASGNTQMLGTLAIPTNAVIEDVIVNSTGSSTVSVGNVSAGTQIVNGASVVSGRQKLTIATPFSTTGNLWVNSSAAVTLQFTILYTVAA